MMPRAALLNATRKATWFAVPNERDSRRLVRYASCGYLGPQFAVQIRKADPNGKYLYLSQHHKQLFLFPTQFKTFNAAGLFNSVRRDVKTGEIAAFVNCTLNFHRTGLCSGGLFRLYSG